MSVKHSDISLVVAMTQERDIGAIVYGIGVFPFAVSHMYGVGRLRDAGFTSDEPISSLLAIAASDMGIQTIMRI